MARITLQDLANELGVHHTTISRALANHPRISTQLCKKVQQLAKKRGYLPDPYLAGLAAYRRSKMAPHFSGQLAWLTNWPTRDGWRSNHAFPEYLNGAQSRAKQLGYTIEEFWLREPGHDIPRVLNVLKARGIQGLLFVPQPQAHTRLDINLNSFSAVAFGTTLEYPSLSSVTSHPYHTLIQLLQKLVSLGYSRPGLVASAFHEERVSRMWSAAFWAFACDRGRSKIPPPLILDKIDIKPFRTWLKKFRPDVIISTDFNETLDWLKSDGWKIPEDIGIVPPIFSEDLISSSFFSGMYENGQEIGSAAVEMLVQMLHRNERGAPQHPTRINIMATWRNGFSTKNDADVCT